MNRKIGSSSLAAWHESGHAVVALALGYEVKSVKAEGGAGLTLVPGLGWMEPNDRARTCLAGSVAEDMYLYSGRHNSTAVERLLRWAEDDLDAMHVEESLRAIGGDRANAGWRLLDETALLLTANWDAVGRLARALEGHSSYLERDAILAVLDLDSGPRKIPEAPKAHKRQQGFRPRLQRAAPGEQRAILQRLLTAANTRGDSYTRSIAEQSLARLQGRAIEEPVLERAMLPEHPGLSRSA